MGIKQKLFHGSFDTQRVQASRFGGVSTPGKQILMLQGPVGPFFGELQRFLTQHGKSVTRACFNAGDRVFGASDTQTIPFKHGLKEFETWLTVKLALGVFDTIILFGADRPAHRIARNIAAIYGVEVVALEEGYIRPGYITIESGGNNAASPIAGRLPPPNWLAPSGDVAPPGYGGALRCMTGYAAAYFTVRRLFSTAQQAEFDHRAAPLIAESCAWIRNFYRWLSGRKNDAALVQSLLSDHQGRYYLVALQVAADSNMRRAAMGWNSVRLISESIQSFARAAPNTHRLVFKIHPMERGHNKLTPLIHDLAAAAGVADRVDVVETGSLGELTRASAGLITINSTSGLSAIHHGVPLLVLGRAIYAHPMLASCAMGRPDFDSFWTAQHVASEALRQRYLAWLREQSLYDGDYYARAGRAAACRSVLQAIHANQSPVTIVPQRLERAQSVASFSQG